jgi:hypothetical protein
MYESSSLLLLSEEGRGRSSPYTLHTAPSASQRSTPLPPLLLLLLVTVPRVLSPSRDRAAAAADAADEEQMLMSLVSTSRFTMPRWLKIYLGLALLVRPHHPLLPVFRAPLALAAQHGRVFQRLGRQHKVFF